MNKNKVEVGRTYLAKIAGAVRPVRIIGESQYGGWDAVNETTGRRVRIKSAQRLRGLAPTQPKTHRVTKTEAVNDAVQTAAAYKAAEKVNVLPAADVSPAALVAVLKRMLGVQNMLMPGLRYISVPDYGLLNDAPREAGAAIAQMEADIKLGRVTVPAARAPGQRPNCFGKAEQLCDDGTGGCPFGMMTRDECVSETIRVLKARGFVKSADGTIRCAACGLHADECTCRPGSPVRHLVTAAAQAMAGQVVTEASMAMARPSAAPAAKVPAGTISGAAAEGAQREGEERAQALGHLDEAMREHFSPAAVAAIGRLLTNPAVKDAGVKRELDWFADHLRDLLGGVEFVRLCDEAGL